MENLKVRNASTLEYNNIKFKSKLEAYCFRKLEQAGFSPLYEAERITLWEGIRLNKIQGINGHPKLRSITYTPDIIVSKGNYKAYIEVKGYANDVYPIKKKMFLKYLETLEDGVVYYFFEPHNERQVTQLVTKLKEQWMIP